MHTFYVQIFIESLFPCIEQFILQNICTYKPIVWDKKINNMDENILLYLDIKYLLPLKNIML